MWACIRYGQSLAIIMRGRSCSYLGMGCDGIVGHLKHVIDVSILCEGSQRRVFEEDNEGK